jgi:hypothetical protein
MPGVRSAHSKFPACLANSSPMMMSGFLLPACQAIWRGIWRSWLASEGDFMSNDDVD